MKTFKSALLLLLTGLLFLHSLPFLTVASAIQVVDDIVVDTVWTAAFSPYEVKNDVQVAAGVTLTIESGVEVKFDPNTGITVAGSLIADGDFSNRIVFTSSQTNPARGNWRGIKFAGSESESFTVNSSDIMFAENGIVVESLGTTVIEKSEVANSSSNGILIVGPSNTVVKDCWLYMNSNGVSTEGNTSSGIKILANLINNNDGHGIYVHTSDISGASDLCQIHNVTINKNTVSRNANGIRLFSDGGTENSEGRIYNVTVSNNLVQYNNYGIWFQTSAWDGGYFYDSTIFNNTVPRNQEGIYIRIASNWYSWISDLTISNNKLIDNGNGVSLKAFRTPQPPMKLVPFDAHLFGNIVSSNNDTGVNVMGDVRANFTGNSISYNSVGVTFSSKENLARNNDIYKNSLFGMYVENVSVVNAQVDAEQNYWGSTTGPFHERFNPNGTGDRVNGNSWSLDFNPFSNSPFGTINNPPTARLEVSDTQIPRNQTVTMFGHDSTDDTRIINFYFDYGDGENSGWIIIPLVRHEYDSLGVYNISLSVVDEFGVISNNTAVVAVTVYRPSLAISAFVTPISVLSQGQVLVEVQVVDDKETRVENASIQLESDGGGSFTPSIGSTDSNGNFNSTYTAPTVSETKAVKITITTSKEGHISDVEEIHVSVVKSDADGLIGYLLWLLPLLALVAVASAIIVVRRRRDRERTRVPSTSKRRQ